jgi:hypothetical protein
MSADREHSPLGFSQLYRIRRCPGSVRLAASVQPPPPSPYAQDGTEAHDFAAWCLENGHRNADSDTLFHYIMTGKSWLFRKDDIKQRLDAVQDYLDEIYEVADTYGVDAIVLVEKRVTFPYLDTPDVWGTSDVLILVPRFHIGFSFDFKYGSGYLVEAEGNEQVTGYMGGGVAEAEKRGFEISLWQGAIVQPRTFRTSPVETFTVTTDYLLGEFRLKLQSWVAAARDPNAPLVPGKAQCKFCPAAMSCPAREMAALQTVNENFKDVRLVTPSQIPQPSALPVEKISHVLEMAPLLRGWLDDVENMALTAMRAGYHIPNWKLVYAQARRSWYGNEEALAEQLMKLSGASYDEVRPRKLIGITEADKLVKEAFKAVAPRGKKKQAAEMAKEALAPLTMKDTSGNLTLAHVSDTRPAVDMAQVNFSNVTMIEGKAT